MTPIISLVANPVDDIRIVSEWGTAALYFGDPLDHLCLQVSGTPAEKAVWLRLLADRASELAAQVEGVGAVAS